MYLPEVYCSTFLKTDLFKGKGSVFNGSVVKLAIIQMRQPVL